jgi:glycosyltransferase involved in cell wall biosynthesis
MEFSVLMSVYAKEYPDYLEQALHSILEDQSMGPTELVLVEDGPLTRELYDVIVKFKERHPVVSVKLPENKGLGQALNEGLLQCRYEWVARMDSDDISVCNRFERQLAVIHNHPELDIVGAWLDEFEESPTNVVSIRKVPEHNAEIQAYAKHRSPVNHPVVMFRKEMVLQSGGYRHCPNFEDYYLWARMLLNGAKFYNIQESLLLFRLSPTMFGRRGGTGYLKKEIRFQKLLVSEGFLSKKEMFTNMAVRVFFRIVPNRVRALMYKKLLR